MKQQNTVKIESQDRREFFRLTFKSPLKYRSYAAGTGEVAAKDADSEAGTSKNISTSGVLFQTQAPPKVSSILWMNLDIRTLKICQEIERRVLIFNNGILGRVVRIEEDPAKGNVYNVGVCFITQDKKDSKEVTQILNQISKKK